VKVVTIRLLEIMSGNSHNADCVRKVLTGNQNYESDKIHFSLAFFVILNATYNFRTKRKDALKINFL
jgi:hypothetical protein